MKKAVALFAFICTIAVIFTATATAIDLAESQLDTSHWDDKPTGGLHHDRLMYYTPSNAAVLDTYTMILGTLALSAALNKLHQTPQPQVGSPPRRPTP